MSEFDVNGYNSHECDIHNHGYYLGAQSQQAKIDELQKQVITQGQNFNDQAQKLKDTEYFNQKLQARVDEALRFYNEAKSPHNIGMIQMAIYLKGNKDENWKRVVC